MTEREALKLALEVLEEVNNTNSYWWQEVDKQTIEKIEPAITAIKEALAQPEQEPVAHSVVAGALFDFMGWLTSRNKRLTLSGADEASPAVEAIQEFSEKRGLSIKDAEVGFWTEFLSTPPQRTWAGLTDEEIDVLWFEAKDEDNNIIKQFARAIETKLKKLNS